MLKAKVKASSISNLTDARYFSAWGVEWLGFNFDEGSADYIPPQNMHAIRDWVDGVKIVGEFSYHSPAEILEMAQTLQLDAIQTAPFTPIHHLEECKEQFPILQEWVIDAQQTEADIKQQLKSAQPFVEHFLLDFQRNSITWESIESGKFLSASILSSICETFSCLISIELAANSLNHVLETINPAGLALRGGAEEKVGFKSFDKLDELFEALEVFE